MCYAWDYPAAYNKTLILEVDGRQRAIKLEEIGTLPPMKVGGGKSLAFDIWASDDGTTQHLDIKWYVETSGSLYRSRTNASATSLRSLAEEQDFVINRGAVSDKIKMSVRILLKEGVGISLVNSTRCLELAYITLQDIRIKLKETETEYNSSLEVRWIQIDNQLFGGFYPIILYPTVVPKTEKELADRPILNLSGTLLKDSEHGVIRFKYFQLLLQEMTAEADEDFLWAILETVQSVVASFHIEDSYDGFQISQPPVQDNEGIVEASSGNIYFELFLLHPIQVNVSFVRTETINSEPTLLNEYIFPHSSLICRWYLSSKNPLGILINIVTMAGLNINDAPITFNAVVLEDLHTSPEGLLNQLLVKYRGEALRQVHKVLGSADFIGNPVGLFNNISAGVQDVFYEPYHGIMVGEGIQELGAGLAKGAKSLVKKTIFSVSDSVSKVTGSVSKGLALATMDQQFQAKRRTARARNRPKHAIGGLGSGVKALGTSVISGVEGLAIRPLEGAEREGVGGFLKGVGKGIAGYFRFSKWELMYRLATKPVVGMFDFASSVSEGVRNTTTLFDRDPLDRLRRPRFIAKDGVVRPYNNFEGTS
jgi:vacuolar protein sorting-associated protein 13A/C